MWEELAAGVETLEQGFNRSRMMTSDRHVAVGRVT